MFRWRNLGRGIPTKDGMYCPLHNKVFSSEADLEPPQYRNRSTEINFMSQLECAIGIGRGRRLGRGQGLGRGRIF